MNKMRIRNDIGHPSNLKPIGQISEGVSNGEISGITDASDRIKRILDIKGQEQVLNSQNRLKELLQELEIEVEKVSDDIGYDYERPDNAEFNLFDVSLAQDSELINSKFDILLSRYPNLSLIYNSILGLFNGNTAIFFKNLIYSNYFELLCYELIKHDEVIAQYPFELKDACVFYRFLKERSKALCELSQATIIRTDGPNILAIKDKDTEVVYNLISKVKVIELDWAFRKFDTEVNQVKLIYFFKKLTNVRSLNLSESKVGDIDKKGIVAVFQNLVHLRHLGLSNGKFDNLEFSEIEILFSYFKNLRSLDISSNKLNDFSANQLDSLFSNLVNLKGLKYSDGRFLGMNEKQLDAIFKHLTGLRSINLISCQLYSIPTNKLKIIFGYLRNVTAINLSGNILGEAEDEKLYAIFGNLINAKKIYLQVNDILPDCKSKILKILSGRKVELIFD